MLFDERLARAQRASLEPDISRVAGQATARQLRRALRRARRTASAEAESPVVAEAPAAPATAASTPDVAALPVSS